MKLLRNCDTFLIILWFFENQVPDVQLPWLWYRTWQYWCWNVLGESWLWRASECWQLKPHQPARSKENYLHVVWSPIHACWACKQQFDWEAVKRIQRVGCEGKARWSQSSSSCWWVFCVHNLLYAVVLYCSTLCFNMTHSMHSQHEFSVISSVNLSHLLAISNGVLGIL